MGDAFESQAPAPAPALVYGPRAIEVELGLDLAPLLDGVARDALRAWLDELRTTLAYELGLRLPAVRVASQPALRPNAYRCLLRGGEVAAGELLAGCMLAVAEPVTDMREPLVGVPSREAGTGLPAWWVGPAEAGRATTLGYRVHGPVEVIGRHLGRVFRTHAGELIGLDDVAAIVAAVAHEQPAAVAAALAGPGAGPNRLELAEYHQVLRLLLAEGVAIRDQATILEAIAHVMRPPRDGHYANFTVWMDASRPPDEQHPERAQRLNNRLVPPSDPAVLASIVRRALARQLCQQVADADRVIHAIALRPAVEDLLLEATRRGARAPEFGLLADTRERLVENLVREVAADPEAVVVCEPTVRLTLRRVIARALPDLRVLAHDEVHPDYRVEVVGRLSLAET